jgi:dinuclear metal center YbgI/SA1388 family protein
MAPATSVALADIAAFLDEELSIATVPDYPGAVNGVQVENSGPVHRVAVAVDASLATIRCAIEDGANLLVVHHGLFWSGVQPLRGRIFERYRELLTNDVAVYSAHLPLDLHPRLGNNALLARSLGLEPMGGFAKFQNIEVGVMGGADISTERLAAQVREVATREGGSLVVVGDISGRQTHSWAICTGAGASSQTLREAFDAGVDTLIVGEGPHHTAIEAQEMGIVVMYAGHYATETFGVRALGAEIEKRFGLPWSFIAAPTGL